MSTIHYRKMQKQDYEVVCDLINQSFGLYRYVNHPNLLKKVLKAYLHSCLAEKTFSCVAEKDGQVIGVILGQAKKKYNMISHMPHILLMAYYGLSMSLQAKWYHLSLKDYKNLHHIYAEFLKNRKQEFDGVLTLFAVSKECRGLGVGKTLLQNLHSYLKENGVERIYLYTDSTCNYGFYDSQGFERLEEKALSVTSEGQPMNMDVYLYGYSVQ